MNLRLIQIFTSLFLLILLQQGAQSHSHHRHHHKHPCPCECPCADSSSSSSSSSSESRERHHHHHGCHHGNHTKPPHHHCPCEGPTTSSPPPSSPFTPSHGSSPSTPFNPSTPSDAPTPSPPPPTTPSQCAQCPVDAVTLTPGNATIGTATATSEIGPSNSAGCITLNVTCTATGGQVFMQFNVEQGGPDEPIGTVVEATLNCNKENKWVYTGEDGSSRVINEVNCVLT